MTFNDWGFLFFAGGSIMAYHAWLFLQTVINQDKKDFVQEGNED